MPGLSRAITLFLLCLLSTVRLPCKTLHLGAVWWFVHVDLAIRPPTGGLSSTRPAPRPTFEKRAIAPDLDLAAIAHSPVCHRTPSSSPMPASRGATMARNASCHHATPAMGLRGDGPTAVGYDLFDGSLVSWSSVCDRQNLTGSTGCAKTKTQLKSSMPFLANIECGYSKAVVPSVPCA